MNVLNKLDRMLTINNKRKTVEKLIPNRCFSKIVFQGSLGMLPKSASTYAGR